MTDQPVTCPSREVFIVRFWREPSSSSWRGQVQQVRSGETTFFRDLPELLGYLERRLAGTSDPVNPRRGGLR